jgi:hypothetical protein
MHFTSQQDGLFRSSPEGVDVLQQRDDRNRLFYWLPDIADIHFVSNSDSQLK